MARQMTATEVKRRILALLDEVAAGDEIEVEQGGIRRHRSGGRARCRVDQVTVW